MLASISLHYIQVVVNTAFWVGVEYSVSFLDEGQVKACYVLFQDSSIYLFEPCILRPTHLPCNTTWNFNEFMDSEGPHPPLLKQLKSFAFLSAIPILHATAADQTGNCS